MKIFETRHPNSFFHFANCMQAYRLQHRRWRTGTKPKELFILLSPWCCKERPKCHVLGNYFFFWSKMWLQSRHLTGDLGPEARALSAVSYVTLDLHRCTERYFFIIVIGCWLQWYLWQIIPLINYMLHIKYFVQSSGQFLKLFSVFPVLRG